VIVAAARIGGIVYCKLAPRSKPEETLLSGLLEPTNKCRHQVGRSFRQQYGAEFVSVMPNHFTAIILS
jgi:hypothetical protein